MPYNAADQPPGSIKIPFLRWWKSCAIIVLWMAIVLSSILGVRFREVDDENERRILDGTSQLAHWVAKIDAAINDETSVLMALHGFVLGAMKPPYPVHSDQHNLSARVRTLDKFEDLCLVMEREWIVSMEVQPTGVVWQACPQGPHTKDPNNASKPLDLLYHDVFGNHILKSIQAKDITVNGPIDLFGGHKALVLRSPVFTNATERAIATWWGNVAVLLDVTSFMYNMGIHLRNASGITIPFSVLTQNQGVSIMNSTDWDEEVDSKHIETHTRDILLHGTVQLKLSVRIAKAYVGREDYGTAAFIAILSGIVVTTAINFTYLCVVHRKPNVVVCAPKTAPFFIIMIDIIHMKKWWKEYPEEMIFIVESIDKIIDTLCAKHGCYKTEPTLRRVFCVAARRYEDAYECALDILIEVSEMAVGDIMQIEMLGNSLPVRATIHHCTNAFVHHDPSINKYIYTGNDMKLAEEMHSLCNQYTLQVSDAAKQYAVKSKCRFMGMNIKHRKWAAPLTMWCALPASNSMVPEGETLQDEEPLVTNPAQLVSQSNDEFDGIPFSEGEDYGSSSNKESTNKAGSLRRDTMDSMVSNETSTQEEQPLPVLLRETTNDRSMSGSGSAHSSGGQVYGMLRLSQLSATGSMAHGERKLSGSDMAPHQRQQQQHVGNTALSSILVKILRDAGEVRLLAPDAVAIPKLFFEAYRILFLGFRAAERNNIFQRLRSSFGLPMNNTMEHLAVRAAIMYVEEEEEDGSANAEQEEQSEHRRTNSSGDGDGNNSHASLTAPQSPANSISMERRFTAASQRTQY